ncbi:MAG: bifunctional demethylmenaquinone methyltransferase/2-methoxy-6-polyprenyl-1,4-benzoquinol methylase UbiE [Spirochaetaceae bacterium]|jgi:demethylmenaquinone methyltransferase/2-methoxy-6-polyprenyl-1,4-benzoquinol methylase|nr:bifunctional demethylmenaquinone methyltransferase/2-methoxy-6-polyprenyl-1,4-benzoquinol methylase UbiE [Spirochaetaceae bacterium]
MSTKIQEMFNNIASNYNKMNKIMTFGMDKYWRRYAVKKAALTRGSKLIDIATGTGDIIFEALKKTEIEAVGLDFAESMLEIARKRDEEKSAEWIQADALKLPFDDETFDAVTSGYLMRNVDDIPGAFNEQFRVLKPGGFVVCLDTTPPGKSVLTPFIKIYLKLAIPILGRILAGNRSAYAYLTESTVHFKTADELKKIMIASGFKDINIKKFMFRTIAVHSGKKE